MWSSALMSAICIRGVLYQHSVIVYFHWACFNTGSCGTIRLQRGEVAVQLCVKRRGDPVSLCSRWWAEITEGRTNNPGGCLQSHELGLRQVGPPSASQWGIWSQLSIQRRQNNVRLLGPPLSDRKIHLGNKEGSTNFQGGEIKCECFLSQSAVSFQCLSCFLIMETKIRPNVWKSKPQKQAEIKI